MDPASERSIATTSSSDDISSTDSTSSAEEENVVDVKLRPSKQIVTFSSTEVLSEKFTNFNIEIFTHFANITRKIVNSMYKKSWQ